MGWPQFFSPRTFATAKCVEVDVLPKIPWHEFGLSVPARMDADFTGSTFRNAYFVIRHEASQETLHFNEMVHVVQWQILGNDLFQLIYALEAFRGSYSTNFLEDMARNITTQFENTNSPFPSEAFVAAYVGHYLPTVFTHYIKGKL